MIQWGKKTISDIFFSFFSAHKDEEKNLICGWQSAVKDWGAAEAAKRPPLPLLIASSQHALVKPLSPLTSAQSM